MATPPGALTAALDELWDAVHQTNSHLPPARVTVSPHPVSSNHSASRWRMTDDGYLSGLVIGVDTLQRGTEAVLETVLHEAAHVSCWQRGIKDTSTRGQYHNGSYLEAATSMGLAWPAGGPTPRVGYATPMPTPETERRYAGVLAPLGQAINAALPYLIVDAPAQRSPQAPRVSIACECDPPRLARMSQTVLDRGPVICGVCQQPFQAV
jgi:hypothetical protein